MNDYNDMYPKLPESGENFRLTKSCDILSKLEKDEKHYSGVRKKYARVRSTFQNISVGAGSLSIILSMSGLGTSLTGFGAVVGIPLGAVAGFCGLVSVLTGFYSKKLGGNISKHEQTVAIARAKINTIKDLISKVLVDQKISDEEFSLIIKEVDKFDQLKMGIRQKYRTQEEKKGSGVDMDFLRNEVRESIIKQLIPTAPPQ